MAEFLSNFKTLEGEAKYIAAYEATLRLWPSPFEFFEIPTQWGRTHIIVSGPQDGQPLVLLHGMHLSATMWFPNIATLSQNYRVYALDTIGGVGRSVTVNPLRNRTELAGWLSEVLDGLGIVQTHIVGHSYGGWLALNFALNMPERVVRLILLAPVGLQPFVSQFWLRGLQAMILSRRSLLTSFMNWMTVDGFRVNELFVEQFVVGMKKFHHRPYIQAMPSVFTDNELRQIKHQTLLLVGEDEVIFRYPDLVVERAKQFIQHANVKVIPGASHGLPMEQPKQVDKYILNFFGPK